jgi:hypothetical protein
MSNPVMEVDGKAIPLPPTNLLFMNESWESFPKNGAGLLALGNRVIEYRGVQSLTSDAASDGSLMLWLLRAIRETTWA